MVGYVYIYISLSFACIFTCGENVLLLIFARICIEKRENCRIMALGKFSGVLVCLPCETCTICLHKLSQSQTVRQSRQSGQIDLCIHYYCDPIIGVGQVCIQNNTIKSNERETHKINRLLAYTKCRKFVHNRIITRGQLWDSTLISFGIV